MHVSSSVLSNRLNSEHLFLLHECDLMIVNVKHIQGKFYNSLFVNPILMDQLDVHVLIWFDDHYQLIMFLAQLECFM